MNDQDIQAAVEEVIGAIDHLNRACNEKAEALRKSGEEERLREWLKGCLALRDSGDMYVSWARHYTKSSKRGNSEEDEDFLDEGVSFEGPSPGQTP